MPVSYTHLAICQEKGKYGELQNYICDLDNNRQMEVAAVSSYNSGEEPPPDETILKIVKLEEGTRLPLEGAVSVSYTHLRHQHQTQAERVS